MTNTTTFLGAGNMATALAKGFSSVCSGKNFKVFTPGGESAKKLANSYDGEHLTSMKDLPKAGMIVLAMKPQGFSDAALEIKKYLTKDHIVVSLLAGISLVRLATELDFNGAIVRVMPNTPAKIGLGVHLLLKNSHTGDISNLEKALKFSGQIIQLENEDKFNKLTGVSGSGPAYLFLFLEAYESWVKSQGISDSDASSLVLNSFKGAIELAINSNAGLSTLREQVTSKKGVTDAALTVLNNGNLTDLIHTSLDRAYDRGIELSK